MGAATSGRRAAAAAAVRRRVRDVHQRVAVVVGELAHASGLVAHGNPLGVRRHALAVRADPVLDCWCQDGWYGGREVVCLLNDGENNGVVIITSTQVCDDVIRFKVRRGTSSQQEQQAIQWQFEAHAPAEMLTQSV